MLTAENKAQKIKYKKSLDIVRDELNKVDPMWLKPAEFAPRDEYELEAEMVFSQIKEGVTCVELAKNIAVIFTQTFGEEYSEDAFYDCARNILDRIGALQEAEPAEKPKKKISAKVFLLRAAILFIGAALTVTSFCSYYLAAPLHVAVIVLLCIVDFAYTIVCSCGLLNYLDIKHWRSLGVVMAIAYVPVFIIGSAIFLAVSSAGSMFIEHIVEIVLSAFFTGPSIIFVILIAILVIAAIGYGA
ncbi:MAG: hypothetical protein K2F90_04235 [Clostridiales bacterium]|nr:hypothetical protein [Clostridiales bacterium]